VTICEIWVLIRGQGCETLVNLSPWGSIFLRKTILTYIVFIFIFYNLNKNVSEGIKLPDPQTYLVGRKL
jgi:hypothetical protein